jgi:hypothetical protein
MLKDMLQQKKLSIVIGIFGCLTLVAAIFQVDDIAKFKVTPRPQVAWPATALGAALLMAAALYASLVERKHTTVREMRSRADYIRETIKQAKDSVSSILMCVRTLQPADRSKDVEHLQKELAAKAGLQQRVRLLAPIGEDRMAASSQLDRLKIRVRHLGLLENLDTSFAVFDSAKVVLPIESGESEQTVSGVTIRSTKRAEMLEGLFGDLWSRFDALTHADYVRFTVGQIIQTSPTIPLDAIAARLHIEADDLRRLLPTFGEHHPEPHSFFVIGRPCSGKTTVADAILRTLEHQGVPREHVYYFNDYEALYERFREDEYRRSFSAADHGGFAVEDFSVLDTVLKQANFRLKLAVPFYSACIVEFARDAYMGPLLNFDRSILQQSIIVHVKCSQKTCHERNQSRRVPSSDYRTGYVPDHILNTYYAAQNMQGLQTLSPNDIIEIDTDEVPLDNLQAVVQQKLARILGAPQQSRRPDAERREPHA